MYKLDNNLQDVINNKATTPMINLSDENINIQNFPQEQQMKNKVLKSQR